MAGAGLFMQWITDDILAATAGQWICGKRDVLFSGISIDSRRISSSELFVAIRGEIHDGHRYCADVVQQGVIGILVDIHEVSSLPIDEWRQKEIACIGVKDTTRALGDLAAYQRRRFPVSGRTCPPGNAPGASCSRTPSWPTRP